MSDRAPRHVILGAAGHVDHGKTALITALTGTNTDRLKEELERGISIELGFAEFPLADDISIGVVDMPGHERFVKQMVAGSGGVDLAMLVVAADEGVMPQTVEHLEILDSLGVSGGVIAMSKIDLVDEEIAAVAAEEVLELIAGTFLEDRPMVNVSALSNIGLDELKAALESEARRIEVRRADGPFRLPIDRVFSLPGVGVVVTGTCWSGTVKVGDRLQTEPDGIVVRVREVQVHGRKTGAGSSGQRLALALHGVKKEDLQRGSQLATLDTATVTRRLDLRIELLRHYRGMIKNRQRLHVHHAGREVLARIILLDEAELNGELGPRTCLAQLHLEDPLVARAGDRLVLRFYSPVSTIAGGVVLDCEPDRHKRFDAAVIDSLGVRETGDADAVFLQGLREAGLAGTTSAEAEAFGDNPAVCLAGDRAYDADVLRKVTAQLTGLIEDYARRYPLRLGIPKEEIRRKVRFPHGRREWNILCPILTRMGETVIVGDRIALAADGPPLDGVLQAAVRSREDVLQQAGLAWPGFEEIGQQAATGDAGQREEDFLAHLADHGRAVAVTNDYFIHITARKRLLDRLREHFTSSDALGFSEFRDLTGLSRKLGIPLLEYLDQNGFTVREGDVRRAGAALEKSENKET